MRGYECSIKAPLERPRKERESCPLLSQRVSGTREVRDFFSLSSLLPPPASVPLCEKRERATEHLVFFCTRFPSPLPDFASAQTEQQTQHPSRTLPAHRTRIRICIHCSDSILLVSPFFSFCPAQSLPCAHSKSTVLFTQGAAASATTISAPHYPPPIMSSVVGKS